MKQKEPQLTDNELILKIKSDNCSDAFLELLKRNERIFYQVCSSYCRKVSHIKYDDVVSEAPYVLNEALKTYKLSKKTKFSTWLHHFSRFFILKQITNKKKELDTIDFDSLEDFEKDILMKKNCYLDKNNDVKDYVLNLLSQANDKRIKTIFELRYFSGENKWNKIAKKIGLSTMGCILLHDRGRDILRKKINSDVNVDSI